MAEKQKGQIRHVYQKPVPDEFTGQEQQWGFSVTAAVTPAGRFGCHHPHTAHGDPCLL